MIQLNRSGFYAKTKTEGYCKDDRLRSDQIDAFQVFAFYRTAFKFEEKLVCLRYRITQDGYLQIASRSCDARYWITFYKYGGNNGILSINMQYKYDEGKCVEENAIRIMDSWISNRLSEEGFPTQFVSPFITKPQWQTLWYSHLYRHKRPYKYQFTHPHIQKLKALGLHPTPTNILTGDWIANCPNSFYHKKIMNVYDEPWKCEACFKEHTYENFEQFLKKAKISKEKTDWYFNLTNNAKYRTIKLKLHADYNYNLLMGDDYFISANDELFCKQQDTVIPLFTTWQNTSYPYNPADESRLEGQIIARLYKGHFTGREMFLYLHKVENGQMHHIAVFLKDKGDSLQEKWRNFYTIPEEQRFETRMNFIKSGGGEFEDVISLVLGN